MRSKFGPRTYLFESPLTSKGRKFWEKFQLINDQSIWLGNQTTYWSVLIASWKKSWVKINLFMI